MSQQETVRKPFKVKLDAERQMKFPFSSLVILSRDHGINTNDPEFYRKPFSPHVLAALVWAGQLHCKNPLTLAQVTRLLPISWGRNIELYLGLMQELMASRGIDLNKTEDEPSAQGESSEEGDDGDQGENPSDEA